MKIVVDYKEDIRINEIKIKSVKYLSDYVIRIQFNDETEKIVDFKGFLKRSSHPAIKKYLDEQKFRDFKIVDGNLNWNDYDMIFPPMPGTHIMYISFLAFAQRRFCFWKLRQIR